jgi:hypothetical protein
MPTTEATMSMRMRWPALAPALWLTGCMFQPCPPPDQTATEALSPIIKAMRDRRDAEAWRRLADGSIEYRVQAGSSADLVRSDQELGRWLDENRLRPQEWTWRPERHETRHETATSTSSYTAVEADIVFADGSHGYLKTHMNVYGCDAEPWRVVYFEMGRD